MNGFDLSLSDQKRVSEIDEILRIDPLNVEILLEKAFILHYGSFDEEAISIYKRILELDPTNLKAYVWLCEAVYMVRDYKFLKEIAESALTIYPNKAEFYKYLAEALEALHTADFVKVQDLCFLYLSKAIELEPDWISTRIALIEYLIKVNNFSLAIHETQEALKYIQDDFPVPSNRDDYQYEYLVTRRITAESNRKDLNDLLDEINVKLSEKNKKL